MPAPMPCGMMRLQAEVQASTTTRDELGQAVESWLTVARVACYVEQPKGYDAIDDGGGVSERTDWRMVCSWHRDVTTKCRMIVHDGRRELTLYVRSCVDPDFRRRRLEIEATEVRP